MGELPPTTGAPPRDSGTGEQLHDGSGTDGHALNQDPALRCKEPGGPTRLSSVSHAYLHPHRPSLHCARRLPCDGACGSSTPRGRRPAPGRRTPVLGRTKSGRPGSAANGKPVSNGGKAVGRLSLAQGPIARPRKEAGADQSLAQDRNRRQRGRRKAAPWGGQPPPFWVAE